MANYPQQMQRLFDRYRSENLEAPVVLDQVYEWAVTNELWAPGDESKRSLFKEEMAQALREEYKTDPAGRRYRVKHPVRHKFAGRQMTFWGDIDKDPRDFMEVAFQQKRRRIAGELHQLKVDVDHYNASHPDETPIQLVLNFEDDVKERLIEEGLAEGGLEDAA
jgi:DNA-directed RNA polymerase subunit L